MTETAPSPAALTALRTIAAGGGIVGVSAPNGNACNALWKKGLIEGRGWESSPYRLTDLGREALKGPR